VQFGDPGAPAALIAHGSGSTADFVVRAFGDPLAAAGYRLVTWDRRGSIEDAAADLAALAKTEDVALVGGVSLGATLAVDYASRATRRLDGVLVALPPWLGPAGEVARLSANAADRIERDGLAATLDGIEQSAVRWVAKEIRAAWTAYGEHAIVTELRQTAAMTGPSRELLAQCTAPVGLVALADDPFHPADVAAQWCDAISRAAVETLPLTAPDEGVAVIGAMALRALRLASNLSGSR
jgi:pimeloyl-ACP methyl ester carboxylesterase